MKNKFKAVSLSYKSAPLDIRGAISLVEQDYEVLLGELSEKLGIEEALAVSTCNRTEVYYVSEENHNDSIINILCQQKSVPPDQYQQYFHPLTLQHDTVQHLYRVSMGLESQVVGDLQISNQIKRSYQWSSEMGMAGPFLHRLMHMVFATNKRVHQETPFRDGAASVSYAAVEMIEELTMDIIDPKILVVGVGEIGEDAVRNLQNTDIKDVTITNRTFSRANELASETGFKAAPFENLWTAVAEADVVISSLPIEDYFNKENVSNLEILVFKCFMDLSVPRSVSHDVEHIPGVLVYTVDDINNRASKALENRKKAIPNVEVIVKESILEFEKWLQEKSFSPTVQELKKLLENIVHQEIEKRKDQFSEEEKEKLEEISANLVNKILKIPVLQLKSASLENQADHLSTLIEDLFDLEVKS